jgi:hypothetical protein
MAYGTVWRAFAGAAFGLIGAGAVTATAPGCGGESSGGSKAATADGHRSTVIVHEPCAEGGHRVEPVDVNNDGKPDIRKMFDGSTEVCRVTDLNRDGHPDLFEYFDKAGQLRRREFDFDDNGVVNQIDTYQGGKLASRELDTTNQGRIDTWDTFEPATGARVKRERDATGDGRIDQWWAYEGERVTILMDRNGDGLPDPDATIVLGADGKPITITDGGAPSAASDAGAATAAPPPPASAEPSPSPSPTPTPASDAGVPGKPQRGGAKR